jgi:Protein of unknown function (DUF2934)
MRSAQRSYSLHTETLYRLLAKYIGIALALFGKLDDPLGEDRIGMMAPSAHGCVHGQAEQHWLAAEREVLATSMAVLAGKPTPKKPRSSPGSKAARTLARAG